MANDDDRDLFEKAMQDLSKQDIFEGKFGDGSVDVPPPKEDEIVDHGEVADVRELAEMEAMFADVDRIRQTKYRKRQIESVESKSIVPESETEPVIAVEPKPQDAWDTFAAKTADAVVIDLRGVDESIGLRTLGLDVRSAPVRIVYEASEKRHVSKSTLEAWSLGTGFLFEFSPDSREDRGLLILIPDNASET